ncbi:hypothetical protein C2G38_119043 [Gigaspora rosea]|uniref:TLD-domain-containing protein n=1 Tax=Gigaspora rosea TaxID=44941 RepID=A0A397UR78_9GLOM|nr:hypothetical protein C2G38_119043 [Gigaspora rosea]
METNLLNKLSNDYLKRLDDKEDYNVIINVNDAQNTKTFYAHSAILRQRSSYFHERLVKTKKNKNNIKKITLTNVTIQHFEIIIRYIYGGVVSLENIDSSFIVELMLASCEFFLEEFIKYLENYLIEEKSHWLLLHFANIYSKSFQSDNKLQILQKWCNDIIVKYPTKFFDSENFTSIQENALISIITRDDLQMDEGKIWDYVIKWGVAQNFDLPSDPDNYTLENFQTLKATIQNCLPHVRYFHISNNDIVENVQPYHQILEKNLWKDLLRKLIFSNHPITSKILPPRIVLAQQLPPRADELVSTIINNEHAAEIASWVDKRDYSTKNNPYRFNLLLRGSKDGFTAASFWNLCNEQVNVIVIMKVKGTDEILGGYNPIAWHKPFSKRFTKESDDCFIFSLKNGIIKNSILSRVKKPKTAVLCHSKYGPCFGGGGLTLKDNCDQDGQCQCFNYNNNTYNPIRDKSTYDEVDDCSKFSVEEYEICKAPLGFKWWSQSHNHVIEYELLIISHRTLSPIL